MVPAAFCGELFQMYPDQRLFHRMQGKVVTVMVVVHTPPFHIISSCIDQPAALDADRIVADPVVDQPCLVGQSVALWKTKKLSNIYIYITPTGHHTFSRFIFATLMGSNCAYPDLTYLTFPPQNWQRLPCQPSLHRHVPFLQTPPFMQWPVCSSPPLTTPRLFNSRSR